MTLGMGCDYPIDATYVLCEALKKLSINNDMNINRYTLRECQKCKSSFNSKVKIEDILRVSMMHPKETVWETFKSNTTT